MGVETQTTVTITCDNPNCPGNSLDPQNYTGWIQLTAQVTPPTPEGSESLFPPFPTQTSAVYCSPSCAGTVEESLQAAEDARNAPPDKMPDEA